MSHRATETRTHHRVESGGGWSLDHRTVNTYAYDGLDRATQWTNFDGSQDTSYAPDVAQTYQYELAGANGYGETTRKQFVGGDANPEAETTFRYGPFGQLRFIADQEASGATLDYDPYLAEFTYSDDGRLAQVERRTSFSAGAPDLFDNAARTDLEYDGSGRLAAIDHAYRTPGTSQSYADLFDFGFAYDGASRIDQIDIGWNTNLTALGNFAASETNAFTFDDAGQLASVGSSDPST